MHLSACVLLSIVNTCSTVACYDAERKFWPHASCVAWCPTWYLRYITQVPWLCMNIALRKIIVSEIMPSLYHILWYRSVAYPISRKALASFFLNFYFLFFKLIGRMFWLSDVQLWIWPWGLYSWSAISAPCVMAPVFKSINSSQYILSFFSFFFFPPSSTVYQGGPTQGRAPCHHPAASTCRAVLMWRTQKDHWINNWRWGTGQLWFLYSLSCHWADWFNN